MCVLHYSPKTEMITLLMSVELFLLSHTLAQFIEFVQMSPNGNTLSTMRAKNRGHFCLQVAVLTPENLGCCQYLPAMTLHNVTSAPCTRPSALFFLRKMRRL